MYFIQTGGRDLGKAVILETKGLSKYFEVNKALFSKKIWAKAVDNVSLKVYSGESLGIVGESGCGKSTFGKTILNLIAGTKGEVYYRDIPIFNSSKKYRISNKDMLRLRSEMQIIFQDPYSSLNPKMKIGDIIAEGIKKHKTFEKEEINEEVKKILSKCMLDESYINKYPFELSGGQRQRVCIGRALGVKPKIVICDEPTAALDVSVQSQILNLMLDLKESENLTYVFISHNLEGVKFFCDRIAVMYLGSIVEIGTSEKVYKESLHPYTKSLISSIPRATPFEKRDVIKLSGNMPSLTEDIKGCKLYNRCPYKIDICEMEVPELKEVDADHFAACHLL